MARETRRVTKKKVIKNIAAGVAHVNSSFNNTKILISDVQGNAIAWSSAAQWVSRGLVNLRLMPLKWQQRMQGKKLKSMVSKL